MNQCNNAYPNKMYKNNLALFIGIGINCFGLILQVTYFRGACRVIEST
jgi:hypothetical protein